MSRFSICLTVLIVLLACVATQGYSIVGKVNIAVLSPVQTTLTVVESADQAADTIDIKISDGYGFWVNNSFPGILGIFVVEKASSSSAASTMSPTMKGFFLPFLLCLLLLCTRVRGAFLAGTIAVLCCSFIFVSAAPSTMSMTITVPPGATLNCVVVAVENTTGSTADCSAVDGLTCSVSPSPDVVTKNCACLRKPSSSADLTGNSEPNSFVTTSGSCSQRKNGQITATVTNYDDTPSCFDVKFNFTKSNSAFSVDTIKNATVRGDKGSCSVSDANLSASCTVTIDDNRTTDITVDYEILTCCSNSADQELVYVEVFLHGSLGSSLASGPISISIEDQCGGR